MLVLEDADMCHAFDHRDRQGGYSTTNAAVVISLVDFVILWFPEGGLDFLVNCVI